MTDDVMACWRWIIFFFFLSNSFSKVSVKSIYKYIIRMEYMYGVSAIDIQIWFQYSAGIESIEREEKNASNYMTDEEEFCLWLRNLMRIYHMMIHKWYTPFFLIHSAVAKNMSYLFSFQWLGPDDSLIKLDSIMNVIRHTAHQNSSEIFIVFS